MGSTLLPLNSAIEGEWHFPAEAWREQLSFEATEQREDSVHQNTGGLVPSCRGGKEKKQAERRGRGEGERWVNPKSRPAKFKHRLGIHKDTGM